jgi:hypothetical protein
VALFNRTGANFVSASGTAATADSSTASHGPALAVDGNSATWFASAGAEAAAWLRLDLGAAGGPYFEELRNVTVTGRCGGGAVGGLTGACACRALRCERGQLAAPPARTPRRCAGRPPPGRPRPARDVLSPPACLPACLPFRAQVGRLP